MTEAEFDKLLRQALLEAVWQENKTYVEQAEEKDIEFSERHLKRREKMLQDPFAYAKKMSRTIWQRMARSAALFFVTLSLLFAMAMTVPSVRAAVLRLYTEWYETHISVHVQNSPKDKQSINLEDLFVEMDCKYPHLL